MTISSLATIFEESPSWSDRQDNKVDRITIHHVAGRLTAQQILGIFRAPERYASANYVIGVDGVIGCSVPEERRAWTSGSWDNDKRSITIEVSNDVNGEPWSVSGETYQALIELCIDICWRYGFRLEFSEMHPYKSLTAHRWFQATACPGDWLYSRFPAICKEVNTMIDTIKKMKVELQENKAEIKELQNMINIQQGMIEDMGKLQNMINIQQGGMIEDMAKLQNMINIQQGMIEDMAKLVAAHDQTVGVVADTVDGCPRWARSTIKKCIDNGILAGSETGLELNRELMRVLVFLDRLGCIQKRGAE